MKLKDALAVVVILGVISVVAISADKSSDAILYTGPSSLVSDSEKNVYINVGTTIYKLNANGELINETTLKQLGLPESAIMDVQTLRGGNLIVAVSGSGQIYKCDFNNNKCNKFKFSEDRLSGIVKVFPDEEGGRLYISDSNNHRLLVYDISGEKKLDSTKDPCGTAQVAGAFASENKDVAKLLGLDEELKKIEDMKISCPLIFPNNVFIVDNELIVSDTNNHRIVALDPLDVNKELWSASTASDDSSDRRIWPTNVIKSSDGKLWVINDSDPLKYGDEILLDSNRIPVKRLKLDLKWDPIRMLAREYDVLIASSENFNLISVDLDGNTTRPFGDTRFRDVLKKAKDGAYNYKQWNEFWMWVFIFPLILLGIMAVVLESRSKKDAKTKNKTKRNIKPRYSGMQEIDMLISNMEIIPGRRIKEHFGLVQGSTVRAKHVGRDLAAGFKNIFGGELAGYTELLQESREEAVERMVEQASAVGANAVLNVRFSTSSVTQGAAELFAYGSAVILE